MMPATERTPIELRDAFYELAMSEPSPAPETLDALIRIYPQFAKELTSFAVDLTIDRLSGDKSFVPEPEEALSPSASRAVSAYHNAMFSMRRKKAAEIAEASSVVALENPFLKMDRAGMRATAQAIGANATFVTKLRDRIIDAGTMTQGFVAALAKAMNTSMDSLWAHLSAPEAVQPQGQHFKADHKPVLGMTQSFAEAVRSSGLSEEQQRHLLSL